MQQADEVPLVLYRLLVCTLVASQFTDVSNHVQSNVYVTDNPG